MGANTKAHQSLASMQMAKQIGSEFVNTCIINKKGGSKCPIAVPVAIKSSCDDYTAMELGAAATFCGKRHLCGRFWHKAA